MPIPNYRLFTISNGVVEPGITVSTLRLVGAGKEIPAIIVGESGPGRIRDVVSVNLPDDLFQTWRREGAVKIFAGSLGKTKNEKWKVFAQDKDAKTAEDEVFCVFRTKYGFRGSASHTGDYLGWKCRNPECSNEGKDEMPDMCVECCMLSDGNSNLGPKRIFAEFPGRILITGICAEGAAGRMASAEQLVAVMPRGTVFRTHYSGRLYGNPSAHYYVWTGMELISATQDERDAGDLF